eukprot:scaffold20104_cov120-Isochrysis_galbana.AAC.2
MTGKDVSRPSSLSLSLDSFVKRRWTQPLPATHRSGSPSEYKRVDEKTRATPTRKTRETEAPKSRYDPTHERTRAAAVANRERDEQPTGDMRGEHAEHEEVDAVEEAQLHQPAAVVHGRGGPGEGQRQAGQKNIGRPERQRRDVGGHPVLEHLLEPDRGERRAEAGDQNGADAHHRVALAQRADHRVRACVVGLQQNQNHPEHQQAHRRNLQPGDALLQQCARQGGGHRDAKLVGDLVRRSRKVSGPNVRHLSGRSGSRGWAQRAASSRTGIRDANLHVLSEVWNGRSTMCGDRHTTTRTCSARQRALWRLTARCWGWRTFEPMVYKKAGTA